MIDKQEIMDLAREFGLAPNIVEKDYVLGWLLAGIAHHHALGSSWIFKGGTCLKKCFFETYRFSEDLDFTLRDPDHLKEEFLSKTFAEVATWTYEATGIELPADAHRFDIYTNPRGGQSAQGRLGFRGPLGMRGDLPRIRLDLTADEVVVLEAAKRPVHHPYSDGPGGGIEILCYRFEEVFAEKLRALRDRLRPRDLYDVIHLHRYNGAAPDRHLLMDALEKKCAFKGFSVPTMVDLTNHPGLRELQADWESMLKHQLPTLPPFEQFWQELPGVLEWMQGSAQKKELPAFPITVTEIDEPWRPPAMAQAWHSPVPLETIRFAAANRLCVELGYQGSRRLIEPYSLRRTKDGRFLLYAVKHQTGESRSYRVDRIQGATVTQIPFVPRYAVELTASGPFLTPPTAQRSTEGSGSGARIRSSSARGRGRPTYVFECSYCGKKFSRTKNNGRLNPHKDKNGYRCSGRSGYLVDTKH
ncbi:MAG: nucleotidyl transferase AbiEii/AbiGii toxin family protein [Nitrospirae bacterium]|nr:nucleotidyl transferase AbiEii/AbiGii toxin family protein [Nitrospirota bacterium]